MAFANAEAHTQEPYHEHKAPWWIKLMLAILLIGLLTYVSFKFIMPRFNKPHKTVTNTQPAAKDIPCVKVSKAILSREDQLPAEIRAYQDVAIFPKVPGFIERIEIDRGSIVKKGQLLVKMYAPEYLAQRNEASAKVAEAQSKLAEGEALLISIRAQLKEAIAKWKRDESTYVRLKAAAMVPGVIATNDVIVLGQTVEAELESVKTLESKVKATESQVLALKNALEASKKSADNYRDFASYLEIRAPFDGVITERNMHVGSFVGPLGNGAYPEIARIQQLNLLRILVPVPERDTGGILPGANVQFSVSTYPGQRFTGQVARLGNYLEQSTRTMPVELNYWNIDNKIAPGAFCRAFWPTRRTYPTLFVPQSAVCTTPLKSFVCLVQDNTIKWVDVEKGQVMDKTVEIFGNIKEGDVVALQATDELRQDTAVSPRFASDDEVAGKNSPRPTYHVGPTN